MHARNQIYIMSGAYEPLKEHETQFHDNSNNVTTFEIRRRNSRILCNRDVIIIITLAMCETLEMEMHIKAVSLRFGLPEVAIVRVSWIC